MLLFFTHPRKCMKRLVVFAACAVAALISYRHLRVDSVEAEYEKFAEAILHRQYSVAAVMCDGLTADDLEQLGSQEHIGAGPAMFQTLFPSRFKVNDRRSLPDGSVVLNVSQTVLFNPVGVESAVRPAMYATLRQVVTFHKIRDAWKVTAFENVCEKVDGLATR
jgi:hypothetical protein